MPSREAFTQRQRHAIIRHFEQGLAHSMNGDSFLVYVREALLPVLSVSDVVVMDNLPSHKL